MRVLTDAEVAEEVAKIEDEDRWPRWPWLPMKNVYRRDFDLSEENDGLGMMLSPSWRAKAGLKPQVLFINMHDLPKALEERRAIPHKDFDTLELLVRDGWIGD